MTLQEAANHIGDEIIYTRGSEKRSGRIVRVNATAVSVKLKEDIWPTTVDVQNIELKKEDLV